MRLKTLSVTFFALFAFAAVGTAQGGAQPDEKCPADLLYEGESGSFCSGLTYNEQVTVLDGDCVKEIMCQTGPLSHIVFQVTPPDPNVSMSSPQGYTATYLGSGQWYFDVVQSLPCNDSMLLEFDAYYDSGSGPFFVCRKSWRFFCNQCRQN
jgi:hypothetical protein